MDRFISNDLVDFSVPVKSDDYICGHVIEPREKLTSSSFEELFKKLAPSVVFLAAFCWLFYLLSITFLALMAKKCFHFRDRVGTKLLAKFKKQCSYKALLLSSVLMTFFVMQLISANLSTETIIVDVSDLMHSVEEIKSTKRKACFLGLKFKL